MDTSPHTQDAHHSENKMTPAPAGATTTLPKELSSGVHAVLWNGMSHMILSAKTRTELAKHLAQQHPGNEVVAVIKGKKLQVKEKKAFSFC